MNKKMDNNEAARLLSQKRREDVKTPLAPERVRVHSLPELKRLVDRLQPENSEEAPGPIIVNTKKAGIADDTYDGNVLIPQSGGQSTVRQTLLDGFEMIKNHLEYHNASLASRSKIEDFGGFPPALAPNPNDHMTWLDTFIDRNMGGRREGLTIVWTLPEGKFRLDPWSCKLEKVDAS